MTVLNFMLSDDAINGRHYRMVLQRVPARQQQREWAITLCFWCMLPKVAFAPLAAMAHSVILASGTLSPATAFVTELGVPFMHCVQTAHVVPSNQVWAGVLTQGPTGTPVHATFQNTSHLALLDELGTALVNVCRVVPGGVLVFAPSYAMLDRLCNRWQSTSTWSSLSALKTMSRGISRLY